MVEALTPAQGGFHLLMLKQPLRSAPLFSKKSKYSDTVALTCLVCGYTAMYATKPENLKPDDK
ncbi:ferric-chelate reductase, putative [Ktedonobacter racemifer DSM 44963]|uniref:Ferric-chelate reductase, putative n=1 Tax=Ktedonobacter racemifer DSM 44963 TaxID=485913 RepID=D6TTK0_KTERA|nr:ferric-chelate reductase, putative [Ktedonobacter racemifer DSM 44963]